MNLRFVFSLQMNGIVLLSRRCLSRSSVACGRFMSPPAFKKYKEVRSMRESLKLEKKVSVEKRIPVWEGMSLNQLQAAAPKINVAIAKRAGMLKSKTKLSRNSINFLIKTVSSYRAEIVAPPSNVDEFTEEEALLNEIHQTEEPDLQARRPIVTIMGHIDHGKTTLLDYFRKSNIVDGESGGITQHLGAFVVDEKRTGAAGDGATPTGIVFLDTPGHSAFAAMRERGATVTDIVLLVVAADDGVMEQTVESINMIMRAKVKCIVVITKIDRIPKELLEKSRLNILNDLERHGIVCEDSGGETQVVEVSAVAGLNMSNLLEAIKLEAELLELRANFNETVSAVDGVILESDNIGSKSTAILLKHGFLKPKGIIVAGTQICNAKFIQDERGSPLACIGPGDVASVSGWTDLPAAGEKLIACPDNSTAKRLVALREKQILNEKLQRDAVVIEMMRNQHRDEYLDLQTERIRKDQLARPIYQSYKHTKSSEKFDLDSYPNLRIVLRADVYGSLQTIQQMIDRYADDRVKLHLVSSAVGNINLKALDIATEFSAMIVGFNVDLSLEAETAIESGNYNGVEIVRQQVIYAFIDEIKKRLCEKLPLIEMENESGRLLVKSPFSVSIDGQVEKVVIAGGICASGSLARAQRCMLMRDGREIWRGSVIDLRQHTEKVSSVSSGEDCGMRIGYSDILQGDEIITYDTSDRQNSVIWDV